MERNADKKALCERYWMLSSYAVSAIFHCIAFVILFCTETIYPVVTTPSTKEALWLYPSLFWGSTTESNETTDHTIPLQQVAVASAPVLPSIPLRPEPVVEDADEKDAGEKVSPTPRADIAPKAAPVPPPVEKASQELSVASLPVSPPPKTLPKPEKKLHETRKAAALPERLPATRRQPLKETEKPPVVRQRPVETPPAAKPVITDTDDNGTLPLSKAPNPEEGAVAGKKIHGNDSKQPAMLRSGGEAPSVVVANTIKADAGLARSTESFAGKEAVKPQGSSRTENKNSGTGQSTPAVSSNNGGNSAGKVANIGAASDSSGKKSSAFSSETSSTLPGGPSKTASLPVAARESSQASKTATGKVAERKTSGAPEKAKGLFTPPITGDIKFELNAREHMNRGVKVIVSFCDYPKSKRGRPLSRAEAKRVRPVTPKIVMPKGNAIHAIIDHAAEGIYYLRVELERQPVTNASITVRLFEGSSRAKNITIRIHSIGNGDPVVRLMMPEGIVWEDASTFSGSLEDSDSETKFNADMGVEWKEYK